MAEQHPIQGLMYTAMQSLKEMIDFLGKWL